METVSPSGAVALPLAAPREVWPDGDERVVRSGRTEGDVEEQRRVVQRIGELGLLDNKVFIERQLMTRLERLMSQKDEMYAILDKYRRKRPLKERLNVTISEIRKLIHPSVTRDDAGKRQAYNVSVLMGYFTSNVRYSVDEQRYYVILLGETPGQEDRLTKEVTLEFPKEVDMSRVEATYNGGVFKVTVPFGRGQALTNSSDEHSLQGSMADTESLPSTDGQSVTSSLEDALDELVSSPLPDNDAVTWV